MPEANELQWNATTPLNAVLEIGHNITALVNRSGKRPTYLAVPRRIYRLLLQYEQAVMVPGGHGGEGYVLVAGVEVFPERDKRLARS